MVIDVLGVVIQHHEVVATVVGDVQTDIHLIHTIKLMRAREKLLVVVRTRAAGEVLVLLLPGLAAIR